MATTAAAPADRSTGARTFALGAALLLVRVPYVLAGHIQEDAFITWRVVRVLAEHGTYGFNPGETVSASSSHAYVLLGLFVSTLAESWFIPAMTFVNSTLLVAGVAMLSSAIFPDTKRRRLLWVCASVVPVALQVSYSGMETSLLVFLVSALVAGTSARETPARRSLAAAALLPWTRPDAIVWPIIWAAGLLPARRRSALAILLCTAASAIAVTGFNLAFFGSALNQTVIAKNVASWRAFDPVSIGGRLQYLFFGDAALNATGVFLPVPTRYLIVLGPFTVAAVVAACSYWLRRAWCVPCRRSTVLGLIGFAVVPPAAYAVGGVLFPWYMWPSNLVASMLVLAAVIDFTPDAGAWRRAVLSFATASLVILAAAQWLLAFHWGDAQGRLMARIGQYLREDAQPADTLLLEPAGYIPYYSGLRTDDEIGLVSRKVTRFMRTEGPGWWVQFLKREKPTYLVERPHLRRFTTYGGYTLSGDERRWFVQHYQQIRTFRYDPADYHHDQRVIRFLEWSASNPDELDVYRRVDSEPPREPGR